MCPPISTAAAPVGAADPRASLPLPQLPVRCAIVPHVRSCINLQVRAQQDLLLLLFQLCTASILLCCLRSRSLLPLLHRHDCVGTVPSFRVALIRILFI